MRSLDITLPNTPGEESQWRPSIWRHFNVIHALCRYKRVFSVGSKAITTLNPGTGEVTNQVLY